MDDNTKELFQCTVMGKDIPEARYNAMTALDSVIGIIPNHHWKLVQMEHGIGTRPDPEFDPDDSEEAEKGPKEIPCVITQAIWVFDPDSEGGKTADLEPAEMT